jgi:hypothetical protein
LPACRRDEGLDRVSRWRKEDPLDGLKVTIRGDTGDWTADKKTKLADGVTDENGAANFALAPGGTTPMSV